MLDEAILANAIPIVDTPMSDPAWPWAPGQNGYLAPLGILYPSEKESLARYGINSTYQECAFSDGAPGENTKQRFRGSTGHHQDAFMSFRMDLQHGIVEMG